VEHGCMEVRAAPRLQDSGCTRWGAACLPEGVAVLKVRSSVARRLPWPSLRWIAWECSRVLSSDRGRGKADGAALAASGPKVPWTPKRLNCIMAVAAGPAAAMRGLVDPRESLWVRSGAQK
jgi:hypothetical protein